MIIYADVLLLVNLSMDILSLYAVGRVIHKRMTAARVAIAAFVGALSSTIMTVFPLENSAVMGVISIIISIAVSVLMTRIAFGKPVGMAVLLRDSVMLWGSGALIGGIMSVVLSMGEPVIGTATTPSYTPVFAIVVAFVVVVIRLFNARVNKSAAEIKITVMSRTHSVSALCDSGSFATEPISGLPVIIVKSGLLPGVSNELHSTDCSLKLRMIPVRGIGGSNLMYGFIPERAEVDGREVAAVVAVDESGGTYAEHAAIVPICLCRK